MVNSESYLKNLTGKEENQAQAAADYLINSADVDLFKKLVDKSDFLFDFVRNNIEKRIKKAVNTNNFKNIVKFFSCYSNYYDDLFAEILAEHANQDLTDEIFELLDKGNISQKSYAAKYFTYIPDTVALEPLSKYAFDENENLAYNSAEALGQMQDDVSFDIALNLLTSKDDFEKLKAVRFFVAYGNNYPLKEIFIAMQESKMPENIAGQIPYMVSIIQLLNSEFKNEALLTIDNIILGLGEILPLSDIFQFELFDVINYLVSNNDKNSGKIAEILLKTFSKFQMFCENQEYIFDENKDTKHEVNSILRLLQSKGNDFWNKQKQLVLTELDSKNDNIILSVLPVLVEYKQVEAVPELKKILPSASNEILICEILGTLKSLDALDGIDLNIYLEKVQNSNIKAVIENMKN